jgi:hypothetical protein
MEGTAKSRCEARKRRRVWCEDCNGWSEVIPLAGAPPDRRGRTLHLKLCRVGKCLPHLGWLVASPPDAGDGPASGLRRDSHR